MLCSFKSCIVGPPPYKVVKSKAPSNGFPYLSLLAKSGCAIQGIPKAAAVIFLLAMRPAASGPVRPAFRTKAVLVRYGLQVSRASC